MNKPILKATNEYIEQIIDFYARKSNSTKDISKNILSFLGLDISSSSTGYSVIDSDRTLKLIGAISPPEKSTVFEVADNLISEVDKLLKDIPPSTIHICIEDFMKQFNGPNYQTTSLFRLAQINSIIHYHCYKKFDAQLIQVHPTVPRHFFHIPTPPTVSLPSDTRITPIKLSGFQFVTSLVPEQQWEQTKNGKNKPSNYDMSDAYLLSLYCYHMNNINELVKDTSLFQNCRQLYEIKQKTRLAKLQETMKENEYELYMHDKISEKISKQYNDYMMEQYHYNEVIKKIMEDFHISPKSISAQVDSEKKIPSTFKQFQSNTKQDSVIDDVAEIIKAKQIPKSDDIDNQSDVKAQRQERRESRRKSPFQTTSRTTFVKKAKWGPDVSDAESVHTSSQKFSSFQEHSENPKPHHERSPISHKTPDRESRSFSYDKPKAYTDNSDAEQAHSSSQRFSSFKDSSEESRPQHEKNPISHRPSDTDKSRSFDKQKSSHSRPHTSKPSRGGHTTTRGRKPYSSTRGTTRGSKRSFHTSILTLETNSNFTQDLKGLLDMKVTITPEELKHIRVMADEMFGKDETLFNDAENLFPTSTGLSEAERKELIASLNQRNTESYSLKDDLNDIDLNQMALDLEKDIEKLDNDGDKEMLRSLISGKNERQSELLRKYRKPQ